MKTMKRIPLEIMIPSLFHNEYTGVQIYKPIQSDIEQAEIIVGKQFGLVDGLSVIERTKDIILVDVEPYVGGRSLSSDPVIPLVVKRTNIIYKIAIKRFTMVVARYNEAVEFAKTGFDGVPPSKWWYNAKARFWANVALSNVPLNDEQLAYFWYQLEKTINNPWRKR